MKKLIALTLVVVCLGFFSLGCGPKKADPPAPTPPPDIENAADNGTPDNGDTEE